MTRRKLIQELPAPSVLERNVPQGAIAGTVYEVCSWRDGPAGSDVPCTEVHLVFRPAAGTTITLRLKSARAVDELVGILLQYRKDVFR